MKDLVSGKQLSIENNSIVLSSSSILEPKFYWDLNFLFSIIPVVTLNESYKDLVSQASKNKYNSIVAGSIIGGMMNISKDSGAVKKSAIIGGTFASLLSSGTSINDARAEITILFSDGESLNVSVDKNEFHILQSAVVNNSFKNLALDNSVSSISKKQKGIDEVDVAYNEIKVSSFISMLFFIFMFSLSLFLFFSFYDLITSHSSFYYVFCPVGAVFFTFCFHSFFFSLRKYMDPFSNEEKEYYDKLISNS